eukprot:g18373.t1
MGNSLSQIAGAIGKQCPRRETSEQARRRVLKEMQDERELLLSIEKATLKEVMSRAAQEAAAIGKNFQKTSRQQAKLREDILNSLSIKIGTEMTGVKTALGNLSKRVGKQDGKLHLVNDLGAQLSENSAGHHVVLTRLETQVDALLDKTTQITETVQGSEAMPVRFAELEVDHADLSQDCKYTKLEMAEDLRKVGEELQEMGATAVSAHSELGEIKDEIRALKDSIGMGIGEERLEAFKADLQSEAELQNGLYLDENKELRLIIQSLADTVSKLESKIVELEGLMAEDEADEIYCDSVESDDGGAAPSKRSKKGAASTRGFGLDQSPEPKPALDAELQRIAEGKMIPRMRMSERVDMIDWSKLELVPTKSPFEKLTKWDEVIIRTLISPPLRSSTPWKMWKEAAWHWARQLRLVGAEFHQMGRHLVNTAFAGDKFEGEHSIAVGAGAERDMIGIMQALDTHFCPHTRTVQAKIESDMYRVRRLDGQAPLLFLMLLKKVFLREQQINEGVAVRMESAKVERALVALMLKGMTTQLIRSKISTANVSGTGFDLNDLEREVDNLNITDFNRYKVGATGQDIHVKTENNEEDVLTGLLEVIGERMNTDSTGHHAVTNRHFNLTQKQPVVNNVGTGHGQAFFGLGAGDSSETVGTGLPGGQTGLPGPLHVPAGGPAPGAAFATGGQRFSTNPNGETIEINGKKHYLAPKLSDAEKTQRNEGAKKDKLKLDAEADWCPFGEFCVKILEDGRCPKKHLKKEVWKLLSQFEQKHPEKYKQMQKEREKLKKEREAAARGTK